MLGATGMILAAFNARLARRTGRRSLLRTVSRPGLTLAGPGLRGRLRLLVLVSVVLAMRIPILVIKPHATGVELMLTLTCDLAEAGRRVSH